jgi:rhamnosyl/mannosyltransferase
MRVLHVYKTFYPDSFGGVEQFISQLARAGKEFGIEAEVLSISKRGNTRNQFYCGCNTNTSKLSFSLRSTNFSTHAFNDFKELQKRVDIVHYHFPNPFMDILHLCCPPNCPTVLTYHSDIVRQKLLNIFYQPLMERFLSKVDAIVATSPNYLKSSKVLSRIKCKTCVIPIGIEPNVFSQISSEKMQNWKKNLGEKFFLFVGVLRYYKGLSVLLKALSSFDIPFVIVGSGPESDSLKKDASNLRLKNCIFLGALSEADKFALLKMCYGFVLPSNFRSEAFGISLCEAARFGKPLISCELGTGTSYINLNNVTGITVPPNNPNALCDAIKKLWTNGTLAKEYGENAKKRFFKCFTARQMAFRYYNLYKTLLE